MFPPAPAVHCATPAYPRARSDPGGWRVATRMRRRASPRDLHVRLALEARLEERQFVRAVLEFDAVARPGQDVGDEPITIVGVREVRAEEGPAALLALERGL